MTATPSRTRKPRRTLDIDELFAVLEDQELTIAEIAYRFAVSKPQVARIVARLALNGELLWTWDVRDGAGRRARRFRPSYVRPHERLTRSRRHSDKQVSDGVRTHVIQLLHRGGELTRREIAFETSLSDGHTAVVLAHLVAEGHATYRREERTGRGQRKRIYRLTLKALPQLNALAVEV